MPRGNKGPKLTMAEARLAIYHDLGIPKTIEEVTAIIASEEAELTERAEIVSLASPELSPEKAAKKAGALITHEQLLAVEHFLETEK